MQFSTITVLLGVAGIADAHFRLLFPEPRGVFVADQEPKFCGGYDNAVSNRSQFPLSGGFFSVKTGHPDWTAAVLISTKQNPTSFDDFSSQGQQQFIQYYAKEKNAGTFCIPLNISAANISGVKDGDNVTLEVVFAGGDGNLYQCADLTLSNNYNIPSNISCSNQTAASSASSTATAASGSQTGGSLGRVELMSAYVPAISTLVALFLTLVK